MILPADSSSPQSESPRSQASPTGRIKSNLRASLRSAFRNSLTHSSESSPVKSPLGRPSTTQGPDAFNVFHIPRARSGSKVIDVNAAIIAQYLPSSRVVSAPASPVAVQRRAASIALLPPAPTQERVAQTPTPLPATEVPAAIVDNKQPTYKITAFRRAPTALLAQQAPTLPLFTPLVLVAEPTNRAAATSEDTAKPVSERNVRRTSLSREHAQLVTRMATLKQERDRAVEDAEKCRAQVQLLVEKMTVLAPILTLLEECRTVGAAMPLLDRNKHAV